MITHKGSVGEKLESATKLWKVLVRVWATFKPIVPGSTLLLCATILSHQASASEFEEFSQRLDSECQSSLEPLKAKPQRSVTLVGPSDAAGIPNKTEVMSLSFSNTNFFPSASASLTDGARPIVECLSKVVALALENYQVTVLGHTDNTASYQYNLRLSARRALSVVREQQSAGIPNLQLTIMGLGENQPIADNAFRSGRALNRRVEFVISKSLAANVMAVRNRKRNLHWLRRGTNRSSPPGVKDEQVRIPLVRPMPRPNSAEPGDESDDSIVIESVPLRGPSDF